MTAKRLFLYLSAGGGLFLLLTSVALFWLWGRVHKSSDDLLTAQAAENQLLTRNEALAKLSRDYHKVEPRLSKIDAALPNPITPELIVSALKDLAIRTGVTIVSFDFTSNAPAAAPAKPATPTSPTTPAPKASANPSISYSVKIGGSFGATQSFLAGTATMTPLTDVKTATVGKPEKETDKLELALQMVSYGGR